MSRATTRTLAGSVSETLEELARVGGRQNGGVTRLAWTPELFAAYEWMSERAHALGLVTDVDAAGNLFLRWEAGDGPAVVVGSHLDTGPCGGRFDGVLGVAAGLHAVAALQDEGFEPTRPLWVAAFMDEEGVRFNAALFGSRAFAGEDVTGVADRVDGDGVTLGAAMAAFGRSPDQLGDAARVDETAAYFELHIEQGPVLAARGLDVGVVTAIVGLRGYRVRLRGEANHAGTTPMTLRRDALAGAARVVLELRAGALALPDATANVGRISVEPGGPNVVPELADFTIDVRAASASTLRELESLVEDAVARVAREEGLDAELEETFRLEPLELAPELVSLVERAAAAEGASTLRLPSGAGHDAMVVGRHVPAAMIFVPSRDGVSHSPEEYTAPEHVELGTRVLTGVLREALDRRVS